MTSDTPPDARQALVQYAARMLTAFGPLPEVVHNEDGTVTIHKPPGPDPIPRYAQLDVWMSLGRNSVEFEPWRNGRSYADAWAELMAGVRVAALKGALGRAAAGEEKPGQVTLQMHYHDNDGLPDQLEVIEAPPVALIGLDFLRDNPASEAGIRLWSDHRGNVFGSPGLGLGRVAYRFVGFQPGGNGQAAALIGVRVEATQEMWDQSW